MTTETSYQWWAAILNTFVHTLMYYYFVVQSFGFRPWWKVRWEQWVFLRLAGVEQCGVETDWDLW